MKLKMKLMPHKGGIAAQAAKTTVVQKAEQKAADSREGSPPDGDYVYIYQNGQQTGPMNKADVIQMNQNGELDPDALISSPDSDMQWLELANVTWLQGSNQSSDSVAEETETAQESHFDDSPLVSCPHCWHKFHMSNVLYISKAPELLGDDVLGADVQKRFVPSSFNEMGYAVDSKGYVCSELACPRCHLKIPEAFFNNPSNFFSVVGAPSSGKSYFLTAMVWMLRSVLPKRFNYTLTDPDTTFNLVLNSYERMLYLNQESGSLVSLPKTELQGGDFSHQIMLNGMSVDLPMPYIFGLVPTSANMIQESTRNIIFYDNAGEHFEPGRDNIANLATQHLALSDGIIYVYDPIKDPRMSQNCDPNDPQVARKMQGTSQIVLINEMIARIRKYIGLRSTEKYDKPLIMVMHKYDAWRSAFPIDLETLDSASYDPDEMCWKINLGVIKLISFLMREILQDLSPDIVAVTESFFKEVYFIPVSSMGHIPEIDPEKDSVSVRAGSLNPIWAEVPVLLQLGKSNLIGVTDNVSIPEDSPVMEIEKYIYRNHSVIFSLPNAMEAITVPSTYFGEIVYSEKAGGFLRIPQPQEASAQTAGSSSQNGTAGQTKDSFWE